jgi:hypothetical protein
LRVPGLVHGYAVRPPAREGAGRVHAAYVEQGVEVYLDYEDQ